MGDPLSVAASITGLIAVAGQLYVALDGFISNVRDAPSLARTIQAEIKSFRNSLNALHRLLEDPGFRRGKRAALISADYVVVSFTDAVLVFSKLETYVLPLTKFTDFGLGARTRWTRKKRKLNELVGRLQWQKHTLMLQLNILQCASDIEAGRSRQVLDTLICERCDKDRDMERRLRLVEQQLRFQLHVNPSLCDRSRVISTDITGFDNLTIRAGSSGSSDSVPLSNDTYQHAFEELLNTSWVYRRSQHREEDLSMRSSVLRPSAWSILTDISLADISIIAVMSLPVRFHELSNGAWYGAGTVQADSEDTHSNPEALAMDQFLEDIADDGGPRSDVNYILDRTPNDSEDEIFICHVSNDLTIEGTEYHFGLHQFVLQYVGYCSGCHEDIVVPQELFCDNCKARLHSDTDTLLFRDGRLFCISCIYLCSICACKIQGPATLSSNLVFCTNCFSCGKCKKKIEDKRFARTSQDTLCMPCCKVLMAQRRQKKKEQEASAGPSNEIEVSSTDTGNKV